MESNMMRKNALKATWRDFPSAIPTTLLTASPFKSAPSSSSRTEAFSCPTGWSSLDAMLNGLGLPSYSVVELTGPSGSGKTQLALSTAFSSARQGCGVLYVDCENGMTAQRMEQLIEINTYRGENHPTASKQERTDILNRISVLTACDPWELLDILTRTLGMDYGSELRDDSTNSENGNNRISDNESSGISNYDVNIGSNGKNGDGNRKKRRRNGDRNHGNLTPAPYLNKPPTPKYDLIIIDCIHSILSPYFDITVSEDKSVNSVSVTSASSGSVGLLAGKAVTIDPIVSSLGVVLKALGCAGPCVLVANQMPATTGPPRSTSSTSSSTLTDIFDIVISITARTIEDTVSTGARIGCVGADSIMTADIISRPPYFNMNPVHCEIKISDLGRQ